MLDAIVVSDIHLGSESCQVKQIENFLENLPECRRLVLNGDLLENTEHRLKKHHWRVLSLLRKLSDSLDLVWIKGNHDPDADDLAHLIGANYVEEFQFESGKKRFLCIHGDIWDDFIGRFPFITWLADWCYLNIQKVSRRIALHTKRSSKTFLRCADKVRNCALAYKEANGVDVICCGHTHLPQEFPGYYNSGCWTDHHSHYLEVGDGVVHLKQH